jgi:hypothetical protein
MVGTGGYIRREVSILKIPLVAEIIKYTKGSRKRKAESNRVKKVSPGSSLDGSFTQKLNSHLRKCYIR